MSLYKWFFKKTTGIELQDPLNETKQDSNDAEDYLQSMESWPQRIVGEFFLTDSGSESGDFAHWAIGEFEIENFNESILVEFKGSILEDAGITLEFEFPEKTVFWINPPVNEYYQVTKLEKD